MFLSHFVYVNISWQGTKKELGSEIDRMDRTLDESSVIIKQTGREVCIQTLLFHCVSRLSDDCTYILDNFFKMFR